MDGGTNYWTDMMTSADAEAPGLNDFTIPMSNELHQSNGMFSEVEEIDSVTQNVVASPTEVQEVPRPSRPIRPNQGRTKNFDQDEDIALCKAWLKVGKDPIQGANQQRCTFWAKVRALFDTYKKTSIVRSESSLQHRWMTIQTDVNKFCSFLDQIIGRNESGKTIQDMINEAYVMYKNLDRHEKSFTLTHCYTRLKDEDKWKKKRRELQEQQRHIKKQKTGKNSSAKNDEVNPTGEDTEPEAPSSEERKRSIGNKKAKEALWQNRAGEASVAAFDKMWEKKAALDIEKEKKRDERFSVSAQLEKERLSNEKMVAEAKLLKEENTIMLVDKSKLDPIQLQYIEIKQKKILERMANEN